MKNLISAFGFIFAIFISSSVNAQMEIGTNDPLAEIEQRVGAYLQSILSQDEYLVFVTPKSSSWGSDAMLDESDMGLPGVPGLLYSEKKKTTHYDLQDNLVGKDESRPSVTVNLVLSTTVPAATQQLIRRVLPMIAKIDKARGDSVRVTSGPLKWQGSKETKDTSWIETAMKFKKELLIFFMMLSVVFLLYGLLNSLALFLKSREESKVQAIPSQAAGATTTNAENSEAPAKKKITREELYSKDSAFMTLTQDIASFASQYPERISYLLTDWIQQGAVGARNAAVLLHNFDLKTSEAILAKLVPSDLDYVKKHFDSNFDKFSDENVKVIYLARIDLMKVTSLFSRRTQINRELDFLAGVEDDNLLEILKVASPEVVAFACAYVPTHRVSQVIKDMTPEFEMQFIEALCGLEKLSPEKSKSYTDALIARHKDVQSFSFTSNTKAQTLSKIVRNVGNSGRQKRILTAINSFSNELNDKVRSQVIIFEDLMNLPDRILQNLVTEESPETLAKAVVSSPVAFQEKIQSFMSEAGQEIFISTISAIHNIRLQDTEKAQAKMVYKVEKMVDEKVIEINDFKVQTEAATPLKSVA